MAEFSIMRNHDGKIIWLFSQSGNHRIVAKSWEEYESISDCLYDIEVIRDQISSADVNDDVKPMTVKKKKSKFSLFRRST